jgi:hypothetical protein
MSGPNGEECHLCQFWVMQSCHCHAPIANPTHIGLVVYPRTEWGDWCGDFKPLKAKVKLGVVNPDPNMVYEQTDEGLLVAYPKETGK